MKLDEYIREIMINNGLSQMQLAKILNVSQKAISNWLNTIDKPNASSLLSIYEKFGITPNELLEIDTNTELPISPQIYTNDEQLLLEAYRAMSPGKRQALLSMLDIEQSQIKKIK